MGMAAAAQRGLQSEINVTPMVDIMLVLLIIFLVVTPFLRPGIAVVLPNNMKNPDVDPKISNENSVVVSIPNDGEYYLGRKRVQKELLADEVDNMLKKIKKGEDRIVYIKGGIGVGYGDLVSVIHVIRKLGVDQIGLVVDKKKDSTHPTATGNHPF
jgi:biopolymer transport protein ExbD/biopolymer transport protein TolR